MDVVVSFVNSEKVLKSHFCTQFNDPCIFRANQVVEEDHVHRAVLAAAEAGLVHVADVHQAAAEAHEANHVDAPNPNPNRQRVAAVPNPSK